MAQQIGTEIHQQNDIIDEIGRIFNNDRLFLLTFLFWFNV